MRVVLFSLKDRSLFSEIVITYKITSHYKIITWERLDKYPEVSPETQVFYVQFMFCVRR
jgi:hypothetical protein